MTALAGIIILGILAQWIAWKLKIPAILPLILTGLLFGPISTFFTEDGSKWIETLYDPATGSGLFLDKSFFYFVSLAIGIILFEGGLTLKHKEISDVGPTIMKLITVGSLITFIGAGILAHLIMGLSWAISFQFSGLIIVTGPTVITPILRNLSINRKVATVLKWEGILIDPIGALVAVLVFEFIIAGISGEHFTLHAIKEFGKIVIIGTSFGFSAAYFFRYLIKKELVPHYLLNVFTLALVLAVFVISDEMAHESGLLAVVIMGMVLGNLDVPKLKEIVNFKESLSILLISILFITLSANIEVEHLELLKDYRIALLFFAVVFILRPISVFASTRGSNLTTKEKIFISWIGPRGIVAAGIASLFGLKLIGKVEGAEYITPLVFMVVLGTVLINATTAKLVARLLGIVQETPKGYLFVGANNASILIGKYLKENNQDVYFVDNSKEHVTRAKNAGLLAFKMDIFAEELEDIAELGEVGYVMAMTPSAAVNKYTIEKLKHKLKSGHLLRYITSEEVLGDDATIPKEGLFSCSDDYINVSEVVRDYPHIHEVKLKSREHFNEIISKIYEQISCVPLFIKRPNGELTIISSKCDDLKIQEGDILVYIGKEADKQY